MNDYILFMHSDAKDTTAADDGEKWAEYISILRKSGQFDGGSSIVPNRNGTYFGVQAWP